MEHIDFSNLIAKMKNENFWQILVNIKILERIVNVNSQVTLRGKENK